MREREIEKLKCCVTSQRHSDTNGGWHGVGDVRSFVFKKLNLEYSQRPSVALTYVVCCV